MAKREVSEESRAMSLAVNNWIEANGKTVRETADIMGMNYGALRDRLRGNAPWSFADLQKAMTELGIGFGEMEAALRSLRG